MIQSARHLPDVRIASSAARRAAALAIASLLLVGGCTSTPPAPLQRFEFSRPEMGMPFRVVLYAPDATAAEAAATAALDRVRTLNQSFSDYEDDSELTLLSRGSGHDRPVPVSADLWNVLTRSHTLSERTAGAFDVTVGPYVQLWRRARRQRELPRPDLLERASRAVGWQHLTLDPNRHTVTLRKPAMRLDLGGIAKGYAIDQALQLLSARGIRSALVNCGGDMAASEPPPGKPGWRVALASPDAANPESEGFLLLARRALATSGDLFQWVEIDGRRYSHIVDPRTGVGLTDHSLVTVLAPDCTTADSLATAVSVLGPHDGLALVDSTPRTAARILRRPAGTLERHQSRKFPTVLRD